jgi:hypothetical protein
MAAADKTRVRILHPPCEDVLRAAEGDGVTADPRTLTLTP